MIKLFAILILLICGLANVSASGSYYQLNEETGEFELITGNLACANCDQGIAIDNVTLVHKDFKEHRSGGGYYSGGIVVASFEVINCRSYPVYVSIDESYRFVEEDSAVPVKHQGYGSELAAGQNFTYDSYKGPGETITINVEEKNIVKQIVFVIPRDAHAGERYKRNAAGELELVK